MYSPPMKSVINVKKKGTATARKTIKNVSKPADYTNRRTDDPIVLRLVAF